MRWFLSHSDARFAVWFLQAGKSTWIRKKRAAVMRTEKEKSDTKWTEKINTGTCQNITSAVNWGFRRANSKLYCQITLSSSEQSVQFSHSVVSDSLQPHESQHARLPCPSPAPGVYSNSCPSSRWCYLTISSSALPFSFCLQCFPVSGSFPMSQLFPSGG